MLFAGSYEGVYAFSWDDWKNSVAITKPSITSFPMKRRKVNMLGTVQLLSLTDV